jgi:pimeloyl-ACP methyl ester carboxylesterase
MGCLRLATVSLLVTISVGALAQVHDLGAQAAHVPAPERVSEQMFVQIGGIPQWMTITGEDRNNPVVLFLHGGPGDALSPYADSMYAGWDK